MEQRQQQYDSAMRQNRPDCFKRAAIRIYATAASGCLVGALAAWLLTQRRTRRAMQLAQEQLEGVAVVSHEFGNALAVLLSAGENLRDGLVLSEDAIREQGRFIAIQAARMKSLADEILSSVSSPHHANSYAMEAIDAADLIEDAVCCVAGLLQERDFAVERRIAPGLPHVAGDPSALSRCLQNLLTNAMKYSGESRWIGITANLREPGGDGDGEIQISVHDRGIGIPDDELKHIFEPFYRGSAIMRTRPGAGLGLSIARRDAEACGACLSVYSKESFGSIFTLHLRLSHERTCELLGNEQIQ